MKKTKAVLPLIALSIICFACNMEVPIASMNLEVVPGLKSITDVEDYLGKHYFGGSPDETVKLILDGVGLGDMQSGSGWRDLLDIIEDARKYVSLDLSGCEIDSPVFDPDYSIPDGKEYIVNLVLPDDAISIPIGSTISTQTFRNFTSLRSVSAANVTDIGDRAFYESCPNLKSASFPKVTDIGYGAFWDCPELVSIYFPKLVNISDYAFSLCTKLAGVNFPAAITAGQGAFGYCTMLASAHIPKIVIINGGLFEGCENLKSADFPLANIILGNAFKGCKALASVSIPNATDIGGNAFSGCLRLGEVSFAYAEGIGLYAFSGCISLSRVNIPKAEAINTGCFANTGGIALTITLGETPPRLLQSIFDGVASKSVTVRVPQAAVHFYNTEAFNWVSGLRGQGWEPPNDPGIGTINSKITVNAIQGY